MNLVSLNKYICPYCEKRILKRFKGFHSKNKWQKTCGGSECKKKYLKEYIKEYNSWPEVRAHRKKYMREYMKEYNSRPEVRVKNLSRSKKCPGKNDGFKVSF